MPTQSTSAQSLVPPNQQSPGSVRALANAFIYNTSQSQDSDLWAANGSALQNVQQQLDQIWSALQGALPVPDPLQVVSPSGVLIATIGDIVDPTNNTAYQGIWGNNLYIGGAGPASAQLFANGQIVAIGQNGQVYVIDPYGDIGAWLGTQSESPQAVTGAVNSAGLIELTVTAHGYVNGDEVHAALVGGVPNANGQWIITVLDANHFTLSGSTFAGAYTSGGTVSRFFAGALFSTIAVGGSQQITGVANNGSGAVRVTVPAHGYSTGYAVVLTGVVGVPDIDGVSWPITVIDANNYDLVGSPFSGAYVSGGLSLNWPTAKLIGRADGSLDITDARISLTGAGGSILLLDAGQMEFSDNFDLATSTFTTGLISITNPVGHQVINVLGSVAGNNDAFAEFLNNGGSVSVVIDTSSATPLVVTGNLNVTGNYERAGTPGISAVIPLAKLTGGGSNGSITFLGGIATAYSAPT